MVPRSNEALVQQYQARDCLRMKQSLGGLHYKITCHAHAISLSCPLLLGAGYG